MPQNTADPLLTVIRWRVKPITQDVDLKDIEMKSKMTKLQL
jgi:hypothetical protein